MFLPFFLSLSALHPLCLELGRDMRRREVLVHWHLALPHTQDRCRRVLSHVVSSAFSGLCPRPVKRGQTISTTLVKGPKTLTLDCRAELITWVSTL